MRHPVHKILGSSILRKQLVAVTGLAMIGFVIAHLAGNLTIFLGPDAFNEYAHKLQSLGPLLWVMRSGMIAAVVLHVSLTLTLVFENRSARPQPYYTSASKGDRNWASRTRFCSTSNPPTIMRSASSSTMRTKKGIFSLERLL